MRILPAERLVLVVPMMAKEYEMFRRVAEKALWRQAAELRNRSRVKWIPAALPSRGSDWTECRITGVVSYSSKWVPVLVDLKIRGRACSIETS